MTAEKQRLREDAGREANWKRWGPYLAERQWATVREDYSAGGDAWDYFPHDHARARAYRWGEDGLLGVCDRECRVCFGLALWNHRDPILKERLFGLTGPQGNHGEDVKELYYYLDSTPTHSYMKALYKYPQTEFPYDRLVAENAARGLHDPEFELADSGVFDDGRYFDVFAEYAKAGTDDLLIRVTVVNRAERAAPLDILPTVWFRNTWSWGCRHEGCSLRPRAEAGGEHHVVLHHQNVTAERQRNLGVLEFHAAATAGGCRPDWLFTHNQTNNQRLFGTANESPYCKDAFHCHLIDGDEAAVNPGRSGTKVAAHYRATIPAGESLTFDLRLFNRNQSPGEVFGESFERCLDARKSEADEFYSGILEDGEERRRIQRQAYAGLLWSKQFYHYIVEDWIDGDPEQPPPPAGREHVRNGNWRHLYARDVLSMPDKWEYPWFAAWDSAFHMLPFAEIDPQFAKDQLVLFLREWYLHPNGQIPAYEFKFEDVNPPVHAWAAWRVYKIAAPSGQRDRLFLERVFQKLLLNFTWWVNRKDAEDRNLFAGGFLGLDNIGVFDRSQPLPGGMRLEQADATGWMAFYCLTMLNMALELAAEPDGAVNAAYEDMASKFFEHFVQIVDAINTLGGCGLWNEEDGFYYDRVVDDHSSTPLRTRSLVGLLPLIAVELLDEEKIARLPGFKKRLDWFFEHRPDLARHISYCEDCSRHGHRLLAVPSRERLERVLAYLFDEDEFLSPFGIRSLSKFHQHNPYVLHARGRAMEVRYIPGESDSHMFGGNSNWRGPIWFPTSFLLVEALERYHHYYGDDLRVEFPTGSGQRISLREAARRLAARLSSLFEPDASGARPCHGDDRRYADDPAFRELILFYEYFHGDSGRGCGAAHQTGWSALVTRLVHKAASR